MTVEPAHLWVPERAGSYGDEAIDLAALAGRHLDDEQKIAVDAMLSYRPGGRWIALESAVVEARQNGKTAGVLLPVVAFDLFLLPPDRIVWTAHLFKTARDAFDDFCVCIETAPEWSRRVKRIGSSHGEEEIELHSGATLEFLARSSGGGRGLGSKRVVFDEALILGSTSLGSLIPTLSARPDPQITYGSSAGKETSEHLRGLRKRGRAGDDPSLIWVEWCDDGSWEDPPCALGKQCPHTIHTAGCALDDEARWLKANHNLHKRITIEYVRSERRAMHLTPREFGRERLGWWEDPPDEDEATVVDMDVWGNLADPEAPEPTGPVAIAVDIPPSRASTSIGVAWRLGDRVMVMEKELPGTALAVATVKGLVDQHEPVDVSLHAGGPAGSLVKPLQAEGVDVRAVSTQETAQATGGFRDLVDNGGIGHLDQQELNDALQAAKTRSVGDAEIWDRDGANLAPVISVTLAAHGLLEQAPAGPVEIEGPLMATGGTDVS